MSNRWGRELDTKPGGRGAGQNNINININFNAMKDKTAPFAGKKIDNFIQISNEAKVNCCRPNVSMQTLKGKKKRARNKQQVEAHELRRKKSKSKIVFTPQKKMSEKTGGDSKSMNKKSTKKRNSKSIENLFKNERRQSPKSISKSKSKSNSKQNSNSKYNSRSKSRSLSQNSRGLYKKSSKSKIATAPHSKPLDESKKPSDKQLIPKNKKAVGRKKEETDAETKKKASTDRLSKKKLSEDDSRKIVKSSANTNNQFRKSKKRSKQKQLKRLPLFFEEEENNFDEDNSYKKIKKEAHKLLFEDEVSNISHSNSNRKVKMKSKEKETIIDRFISKTHSYQDIKKLDGVAKTIQRYWRGYRARNQFINELNLMNHKIQMTKKKIASLDPKFWDDAGSNSIVRAEDAESSVRSQIQSDNLENMNIQIEKPSSDSFSTSKKKLSMNRILEYQSSEDVIEKLNRLEEEMKEQRQKYKQLELENNDLKQSLQKVSIQSGLNSGVKSVESSLKSNLDSWQEIKINRDVDNFMEVDSKSQEQLFELRLPKKIERRELTKVSTVNEKFKSSSKEEEQPDRLSKYKNKMEAYECSSPKHAGLKTGIDSSLLQLFKRKEHELQDKFAKKSNMYEKMLQDTLFSPRTYNFKKSELDQMFHRESEIIKSRLEQAQRVVSYAKEIELEEIRRSRAEPEKQKILREEKEEQKQSKNHHVIEDYGNINLNSHRSKQQSEEVSEADDEHRQSEKIDGVFLREEIQASNQNAIKIFQQVSSYASQDENEPPQLRQGENKSKGLETTLLFIKEYCVSFIEFIRSSDEYRTSFIDSICSPIVFDNIELLKAYRTTVYNESDRSYNSQQKDYEYPFFRQIFPKSQVISREAFTEFNSSYEKLQVETEYFQERDFFLNSLLDTFNESLDYQRPCSYYGESPPWIYESKVLKNNTLSRQILNNNSEKFDEVCGTAIAKVIEWSTYLCGFIPESPEIVDMPIEKDQIDYIRQTRIALMLEKDLLENEQQMLDSLMEQTEVKLSLGEAVVELLLQEFIDENRIFFK